MTWPVIFANLAAGNQPLSLFDTMFTQVAELVAIPCLASGANAIALTPIGNAPTIPSYTNFQMFRFKAAGTSTAAVTVQFTGLSALPVFQKDGVTQCAAGALVGAQEYLVCFDQSRNAGAGGFYLEDAAQPLAAGASPVWGPFATLASAATTDLSLAATIQVFITGTATITSFGPGINLGKVILFQSSLLLTNVANTLVLPGNANIQTAANDMAIAMSNSAGTWFVIYSKRSGAPILTGTSGVPLIGQGAGSDSVHGTAIVAGGGTGVTTLAAHGVVIGEGTSPVAVTGAGTAGQVLTSNGAAADPTFQAVPATGAGVIAPTVQTLTASQTVTIPANATKCKVTLVGAGGGGGGCVGGTVCSASIGGTGGTAATLIKYLSGLTAGNTLILTIGAAGTGGAAGNNNGANGGDTTLASGTQTITTLTAGKGGGGGGAASGANGTNGLGGAALNGDLNFNGPVAKNISFSWPGPAPLGFSPGIMDSNAASRVGSNALDFGGGATGGCDPASGAPTARAGGNGTAGVAIFEWYA